MFLGGAGLASDGGEPTGDLLEEGAGRRPERRGSFGEGGGPMVATLAIADVGRYDGEMRKWEGMVEGRDTDNGPHFPVLCLDSRFWLISPALGINDGAPRLAAIPGLLVTVSDLGHCSRQSFHPHPHPHPWPCPLGHSTTVLFMNGSHTAATASHDEDIHFSDNDDDEAPDPGLGDYSARFDELMSDGEDHPDEDDEDDEEEAFIYDGVDADPTGGYREQLRDVLGPDHEEDELEEEQEVERSLVHEVAENEKFAATIEDEAGVSYSAYMPRRFRLLMLRVVVACPGFASSLASARFSPDNPALVCAVEHPRSCWKRHAALAAFCAPVLAPFDIPPALLHPSALARGLRSQRRHTSFPFARVDLCRAISLLRALSLIIGYQLVSSASAPGGRCCRRSASDARGLAFDPVARPRRAHICGTGIQGVRLSRDAFRIAHSTCGEWTHLYRDRHRPGAGVRFQADSEMCVRERSVR